MRNKRYRYVIPKNKYDTSEPVFIDSKGQVVARGYNEYKGYLKSKSKRSKT